APHRLPRLADQRRRDRREDLVRQIEIDARAVGQQRRKTRRIVPGQLLFHFARFDEETTRIGRRRRRQTRLLERPTKNPVIEIVAAERGVAVGGQHFEYATRQLEDRDIERAAAQVINRVSAFGSVVEPVRDRRGGGLVQQSQHWQAGNLGC